MHFNNKHTKGLKEYDSQMPSSMSLAVPCCGTDLNEASSLRLGVFA